MKNNTIVAAVFAAAFARLEKPESKPRELSEKEKAIQAFFDENPFDCQAQNAARLVGLLTGFTPSVASANAGNRPEMFEIWLYQSKPLLTISTKANPGYSYGVGLDLNHCHCYYWTNDSNSKRLTPAEQKDHLPAFVEKWNDAALMAYIGTMGQAYMKDFLTQLEAADTSV